MRESNYAITLRRMRAEFLRYDQERMIRRFSLAHDDNYIYIDFTDRHYRIGRGDGLVEWSADGFASAVEADFNESMTIYDVLCCAKEGCAPSGRFCTLHMLRGTVKSAMPSTDMLVRTVELFAGRLGAFRQVGEALGRPVALGGDAAFLIDAFPFLSLVVQFWDADEEFPASLKFMFDENITDFMHIETIYYMMGHIAGRMEALLREVKD